MEYIIICELSPSDFEKAVQEKLNDSFELFGAPFSRHDGNPEHAAHFCQALTRVKKRTGVAGFSAVI